MTVSTPGTADGIARDAEADDDDVEIVEDGAEGVTDAPAAAVASAWRGPSIGRWILFAVLAIGVVVLDQLAKSWVLATLPNVGDYLVVLEGWLNIVHGRNSGALFGMLPQSAPIFAVVSLGVVGLIVYYHRRAGRGIVMTIALALLLGGAIGNLLDRVRHGSVVDFVDMGIGAWRFYTYNIADAAITTAIILLIGMAIFPRIAEWGADA